jgi:hypothetical protein
MAACVEQCRAQANLLLGHFRGGLLRRLVAQGELIAIEHHHNHNHRISEGSPDHTRMAYRVRRCLAVVALRRFACILLLLGLLALVSPALPLLHLPTLLGRAPPRGLGHLNVFLIRLVADVRLFCVM